VQVKTGEKKEQLQLPRRKTKEKYLWGQEVERWGGCTKKKRKEGEMENG